MLDGWQSGSSESSYVVCLHDHLFATVRYINITLWYLLYSLTCCQIVPELDHVLVYAGLACVRTKSADLWSLSQHRSKG